MTKLISVLAAAALSLGFVAAPAVAAEVPAAKSPPTSLVAGPSIGLPTLKTPVAEQAIEVAQRFRRRRSRRRGRAAGVAIGLGILGAAAIIAASRAKAKDRRHYRSRRASRRHELRRRCHKWLRRCDRGVRRACFKYDEYCAH